MCIGNMGVKQRLLCLPVNQNDSSTGGGNKYFLIIINRFTVIGGPAYYSWKISGKSVASLASHLHRMFKLLVSDDS